MTYHDVAAIRSVLAIPGFILVAVLSARRFKSKPSPKPTALQLTAAASAGLWCYYFGALANFYALTLIQANVERALLFSYPAMVVFFSAITARAIPSKSTMLALATTSLGVLLVTGLCLCLRLRPRLRLPHCSHARIVAQNILTHALTHPHTCKHTTALIHLHARGPTHPQMHRCQHCECSTHPRTCSLKH